jgi:aerobic carbon-monoxide dehydrogenase large subunit
MKLMSKPHSNSLQAPKARSVFGKAVTRIEDAALVSGRALFVDDLSFPRQLHMRVVRSPYAYGRILSVNAEAARDMPGVHAVWTSQDVMDVAPIAFRDPEAAALDPYRQYVLARDMVRYVGEPVAAIFADDPYVAEDAADAVLMEIEPLDALIDARQEPGEFSPGHGTEATVLKSTFDDIDAAFDAANTIVELEFSIGRHSGVPLETRGAIGTYNRGRDVLELFGAAKVPHRNREVLSSMLGRSRSKLHLHEAHVGGAFGVRGELYPEDILVLVAAERFCRPVKWIEDRRENLMATNHSRQQHHRIRAAVNKDGRILGIDCEILHDQGAYVRTPGSRVLARTMIMLIGPYSIGAYRAVGRFRLTNKTPAGTFRAPGRYEGTFVRERLIDVIADRMGLDRMEIRRRNLIRPEAMPYTIAYDQPDMENLPLDSGDYPALLDRTLTHIDWEALQADVARRRRGGECVGVGLAFFIEESGRGPTDGARVTVDVNGSVEVVTGGASSGQGFETAMAQICAEALGVDYRQISVIHGQTDRIPFGIGAHAGRATVMTGNAVHAAACKVRNRALSVAARLLQTQAESLDIHDGVIFQPGNPHAGTIGLGDVATRLEPGSELLDGEPPGLGAEGWFSTKHPVFPYGAHFAQVCVDRATGKVNVERYLIAYDVGRSVNPGMVEGQLVGACIQGLGGALLEEFKYSENGDPLSVTFADYLLPTASDAPPVECLVTEDAPSPRNPLGLKGAGEGGINAVGGAIGNAIADAIGKVEAITELPVTPQRLYAILSGLSAEQNGRG